MAPAGFAGNASRSAGLSVFRYAGFFDASMTCWRDIEIVLWCCLTVDLYTLLRHCQQF